VGALILDASVLIGLLDSEDTHHEVAVEAVERADLQARKLITPASAYSEALFAFARADRLEGARDAVAGMGISVAPMSAARISCASPFGSSRAQCSRPARPSSNKGGTPLLGDS
jgi:PIN domain